MIRTSNRRRFLQAAAAGPLAAALSRAGLGAAGKQKRPNIVFLLTDDQRFNALGCMGNREIQTPNMDKLGADGVVFENHYATTSICMASRATIMTGMYEYKTGCNFNHGSLAAAKFALSYPVLLRQAGYRTGFAGKFGFAVTPEMSDDERYNTYDRLPVSEFDWWRGWTGQGSYDTARNKYMVKYAAKYPHVSRALGAAAQEFIRESAGGEKPFCLSISFKAPHKPPQPDPAYLNMYRGVTFSKWPNWGPEGAAHLPPQALAGRQYQQRSEWYPEEVYQERLRKYYQQIYGVDVAIGMIREELDRQGVADNTVIIFTSDNGYFCGSHSFQGKLLAYEEGSRVPLIIYDPRHRSAGRGERVRALTGNIDMAPTILDFAGLPQPKNMDGKSLAPLLGSPGGKVRDALMLINVWPYSVKCQAWAVVTTEYKYIYWFYGDKDTPPAEELYALREDPYEMSNAAGKPEYSRALRLMRDYYDEFHEQWKRECVPGNGYPEYVTLADRHIPWQKKQFTPPK